MTRQEATPLFVGFAAIEDLAGLLDAGDTVFLLPVATDGESGTPGITTTTHTVVVQARLDGGEVGYVTFPTGRHAKLHGRPFGDREAEAVSARTDSAHEVITRWLTERGLSVVRATIAGPRNYKYLHGTATFLRYDPQSDTFVPTTS